MRWLLGVLGLLLPLILTGCAAPRTHRGYLAAVPPVGAPLPPRAKIFLVAGGVEVANFAAEVVAQRRLWLDLGYAPDEVVCYWARPGPADFRADRSQYRELAAELRACYPASAALLREHLQQASRRAPPFVYLYVSSHGRVDILPEAVPEASLLPSERALFDQPVIQLGDGVGRGSAPGPLALALRRGADPDSLVLAPRPLRDLLLAFPAATRKFVVLQACHSGGFLVDPRPGRRADTLAAVPGLTAIAAARIDRTSFGCHPGARMTYFGATYLRLLAAHGGTARALERGVIDWAALFHQLSAEIAALERDAEVRASLPMLLRTP